MIYTLEISYWHLNTYQCILYVHDNSVSISKVYYLFYYNVQMSSVINK